VSCIGHRSPYVYFPFVLTLCINEDVNWGGCLKVVAMGHSINEWFSMDTKS
jgi:hypothetical protein